MVRRLLLIAWGQDVFLGIAAPLRGNYGKSLLKQRGEFVERSFALCYETSAMRRCTLRGTKNILRRQLIHVGAFNISLVLREMLGAGTPRELKNRVTDLILRLFAYFITPCGAGKQLLAHRNRTSPLTYGFCTETFCC
jgi:hypothetical protein